MLATCMDRTAPMPSNKTPTRSRSRCPQCGGPLYYINTAFSFFTGKKKRICMTPNCAFVDARRFKVVLR
jgi:ribosomal protein S14